MRQSSPRCAAVRPVEAIPVSGVPDAWRDGAPVRRSAPARTTQRDRRAIAGRHPADPGCPDGPPEVKSCAGCRRSDQHIDVARVNGAWPQKRGTGRAGGRLVACLSSSSKGSPACGPFFLPVFNLDNCILHVNSQFITALNYIIRSVSELVILSRNLIAVVEAILKCPGLDFLEMSGFEVQKSLC